ncbi:ATP-binding protein [Streptomyces coelicoflavus]|uniref:DUF6302 family protein n=1 Tax=Streptomyces coelicoflavus TaxID=285562 RepID=UPI0032497E05
MTVLARPGEPDIVVMPPAEAYDFEYFRARVDAGLLSRSIAVRVFRMPFLAVPVGGARRGGWFGADSLVVALAVRDVLAPISGFSGARIVWQCTPRSSYAVEWGDRPPATWLDDSERLSFYGLTQPHTPAPGFEPTPGLHDRACHPPPLTSTVLHGSVHPRLSLQGPDVRTHRSRSFPMSPRPAAANTAVRAQRTAPLVDGEVMNERIVVAPRRRDDMPRPQDAARVGVLRRIAAARLKHHGLDALIDDVLLISSELLTNALLHSGAAEITLNLTVRGGCLRITVIDGMPGRAERRKVDDEAETGRGLGLIAILAAQSGGTWGTSEDGAATWCSLHVPAGQRQ